MKPVLLSFLLLCYLFGTFAYGEDDYQSVIVADPYIEFHTGPGAGYPIFHVVERGESITILKSKTDFYKVRSKTNHVGWVDRQQLLMTLAPSGEKVTLKEYTTKDFTERHWEVGMMGGQFGGATVISFNGSYAFNKNLSAELTFSQAIGNISSSLSLKGSLLASPFPDWRISPYFSIGTGGIQVRPIATLVEPEDTTHQFSTIGIGVRTHITRTFVFRLEYNDYVIYSANNDNDQNEALGEWKAGFAVFF